MNQGGPDDGAFARVSDAPGRLKGRLFEHRVTIEAPPELVWDFIADIEGWASSNPLYRAASGSAREGGAIRLTVDRPGLKPRTGKGYVLQARTDELLEYRFSRLAGLFKAHRTIEIEELSPTRCRVVNGDILGGPIGRWMARSAGAKVAQGLEAMNLALKQVAERKWRGRPG